jgi:hypothetical protein
MCYNTQKNNVKKFIITYAMVCSVNLFLLAKVSLDISIF